MAVNSNDLLRKAFSSKDIPYFKPVFVYETLILRGENVTLAVSFFSDMAATIPIVPLDVAIYPAYTIYDIDNQPVQSGVGQLEASPGRGGILEFSAKRSLSNV